jgi:PiT family inorganic phosphate transporter
MVSMSQNSSVTTSVTTSSLDAPIHPIFKPLFFVVLISALVYIGYALHTDLATTSALSFLPFLLLTAALFVALGFEFANGFHDTANAVVTVIYTNALSAPAAVGLSGVANFLGVLSASGIVAYGILALLPVELILNVGSSQGFAMVFALLLAAIIWNLGTWVVGVPASSSHTLIGSIIGVGIMNRFLTPAGLVSSSVNWDQAAKVGKALLFSPLLGFVLAAIIFLISKVIFSRKPELFEPPEGTNPPPFWVRSLLVLSCAGVSFVHGSNDGQKGMGLIMLVLIGIVPMAYSLNKTMDAKEVHSFAVLSEQTAHILSPKDTSLDLTKSRDVLTRYLQGSGINQEVLPAVAAIEMNLSQAATLYKTFDKVPKEAVHSLRNDTYLIGACLKRLQKNGALSSLTITDQETIQANSHNLDKTTQFIPTWVKVAVALALSLGTLVGWKRIAVTVGEKIGNQPMNYGQGFAAQLSTIVMIGAADVYGLPVSTTHVLNGSVAGTMTANKSGLQWGTIKRILYAWVLTLPAAMTLSAALYWLFMEFI